MPKPGKPIPDGYHTVTSYLTVKNAAEALEFYKRAFGAEEIARMHGPDGKSVMHAEFKIGDSFVMLADEWPQGGGVGSPKSLGGTTVTLFLYVNDVDALFKRAVAAGATATMPPTDTFWGDRYGKVSDPFGHAWSMATHKLDMTPEEMKAGQAEFFKSMAKPGN
jgi:PhnB protein